MLILNRLNLQIMLCEKKSSKCHCWDVLNNEIQMCFQIAWYFILQKVINLYVLEKSKKLKFNLFFHLDKVGGEKWLKLTFVKHLE